MTLFDRYLAVDWSAAGQAVSGRDSIWIAKVRRASRGTIAYGAVNPRTRASAMEFIGEECRDALAASERVLLGFDFAFGYPRGVTEALTGRADWQALWALLSELVEDGPDNRSNRYGVAEALNRRLAHQSARFWGHPHQHAYADLAPRKPVFEPAHLPERRLVEMRHRGAKPIWQLAYNGSVGSQALLGIPRLHALRTAPGLAGRVAIWPFETAFERNLEAPIIIAEIYPSLTDISADPDTFRDRAQVRAVSNELARADREGRLVAALSPPPSLTAAEVALAKVEEGWILAP